MWFSPEVQPFVKSDGTQKGIKSNIATYINNTVAHNDGYEVTVKKSDKTSFGRRLTLICTQGRTANIGKGNVNQTQTGLSQSDDTNRITCGAHWPMYYDDNEKLCFVKKHCSVNFEHSGHVHTERQHMKIGASDIPDNVRKYAEEMLNNNCSTAVVQLLMSVMGADKITNDSISKMRRAVLIKKHKNDKGESTAETLLKMLDDMEGVTCCYMTGSYDEALNKVRVRKGKYTCVYAYMRISFYTLCICVYSVLSL